MGRSLKKGPFVDDHLLKKIDDLNRKRDKRVLQFTPRAAALPVKKVLDSAIANAEHNYQLPADTLFVAKAYVDEGPTLNRFRPRALGRAYRIRKRTSHITVVVDSREA